MDVRRTDHTGLKKRLSFSRKMPLKINSSIKPLANTNNRIHLTFPDRKPGSIIVCGLFRARYPNNTKNRMPIINPVPSRPAAK